jgi:hypothetical protein
MRVPPPAAFEGEPRNGRFGAQHGSGDEVCMLILNNLL